MQRFPPPDHEQAESLRAMMARGDGVRTLRGMLKNCHDAICRDLEDASSLDDIRALQGQARLVRDMTEMFDKLSD